MRLDDAYRLLDLSPSATDEEVRAAHRDLTKVWHPDRFANDPRMQQKAEETLKRLNEALEVIRSAGPNPHPRHPPTPPSRPRRGRPWWTYTLIALAFYILLRRPTPGGLAIAATLFVLALVLSGVRS